MEEKSTIINTLPEGVQEREESQEHEHHHYHHHHSHHHHHSKSKTQKEKINRFFQKHKWKVVFAAVTVLLDIGMLAFYADRLSQDPGSGSAHLGQSSTQPAASNNGGSVISGGTNSAQSLYSFGVLSDLHLQYGEGAYGGVADFRRALEYLQDKVAFTCIAGDLVAWAGTGDVEYFDTKDYMEQYKECVERYAGDMPIYECAGNHETYPAYSVTGTIDADLWEQTTGKQLYYSFTHGEDVFLFLSLKSTDVDDLFPDGGLEWLEETLQENQNKRCFVFQHSPEMTDKSADPSRSWSDLMNGSSGEAFVALMKKYPNTVWFHGHTHLTLEVDQYPVTDILGYKSVHVPSLVSPRFYDTETDTLKDFYFDREGDKIWGSEFAEGYIVDVYENKIIVRGINFAAGDNRTQVEVMEDEIYALSTILRITE